MKEILRQKLLRLFRVAPNPLAGHELEPQYNYAFKEFLGHSESTATREVRRMTEDGLLVKRRRADEPYDEWYSVERRTEFEQGFLI